MLWGVFSITYTKKSCVEDMWFASLCLKLHIHRYEGASSKRISNSKRELRIEWAKRNFLVHKILSIISFGNCLGIFFGIFPGILFGILFLILFWILFWILILILFGILFGILFRILFGILFEILFGILFWILPD